MVAYVALLHTKHGESQFCGHLHTSLFRCVHCNHCRYGDEALDVAFEVFFKLLVSVPIEDVLVYPKLCKAYYSLLVAITRDHLPYLATRDSVVFEFFARSILEGIKSVDVQICTQCCTSLDFLLSNVIVNRSKSKSVRCLMCFAVPILLYFIIIMTFCFILNIDIKTRS